MSWDEFSDQPFAVKILKSHARTKRFASCYLISGANDETQTKIASFFCAESFAREDAPDDGGSHLRRIIERNHPDVLWAGDHDERSIKIEEVRSLSGWAAMKPYESNYKFGIIRAASRMTLEAANKMLKILEEPPGRTVFILLAESKSSLIETIQSRVFEVRLKSFISPLGEQPVDLPLKGEQTWEEYLDQFRSCDREQLTGIFSGMLTQLQTQFSKSSLTDNPVEIAKILSAADLLYESLEAVSSNVNVKLCLTRLAMQMRRVENGAGVLS